MYYYFYFPLYYFYSLLSSTLFFYIICHIISQNSSFLFSPSNLRRFFIDCQTPYASCLFRRVQSCDYYYYFYYWNFYHRNFCLRRPNGRATRYVDFCLRARFALAEWYPSTCRTSAREFRTSQWRNGTFDIIRGKYLFFTTMHNGTLINSGFLK